jgi:hypothetical protein
MDCNGIIDGARQLIADHIVSVEQLEILLLLRAHPAVQYTAQSVSDQIRTSELSASQRLADLASRGFLSVEAASSPGYRYAPRDERLGKAVDALAQAYAERPYTVIELIFAKPLENLQVYADAFRFRKDDSDG